MADIRIIELPLATGPTAPSASDAVALDGLTTRRSTLAGIADAIRPLASQSEAEAGTNAVKTMTPLTVKQAIVAQGGATFATAAEGDLATSAMQPSVYDSSAKEFNVYDQSFRNDSPRYYGAVGDGTNNDTTAYQSAEAVFPVVFLPAGSQFNLASEFPTKPVYGPGQLKINGATIGGFDVEFESININVLARPPIYSHLVGGDYDQGPPDALTAPHYNVVIAPGFREGQSAFPAGANIRRSSFVGVEVGRVLQVANRVEVMGNAALKHARYAERGTFIGSLAGQWLGQDLTTDPLSRYYQHDLFWNGGTTVTNPAWNAYGLETIYPGIRAEIAAWANWASSSADVEANVFVGRDSGNLLRGIDNTNVGYRAGLQTLEGSYNTRLGAYAGWLGVFGDGNTHVGYQSGISRVKGNYNTYLGYNSGYSHKEGLNNVFIGRNSGQSASNSYWSGDGNVLIGRDAGRRPDGSMPSTMSNLFALQGFQTQAPLISGTFGSKVSILTPYGKEREGRFGVYMGDSGFDGTFDSNNGMLFLEHNTNAGSTILTPNTAIAGFYMGDPQDFQAGGISYNHALDQMRIRVNGTNRYSFTDTVFNINNVSGAMQINATQVLSTRKTGWAAPTGTATRTTFATSTVTLPLLAERVKALIDDLTAHGLIGA